MDSEQLSAEEYQCLFTNVEESPEPKLAPVEGTVPSWIRGTLLKNGPGIFKIGPDEYDHYFDGLALIQRFRIENGQVFHSTKHLRSNAYEKNMAAQRIVVSEFGTAAHPDPCKNLFHRYFSYFFPREFTDNDLVNFVQCGDEVYASSETAILNQVDVASLDTIQQVNMKKYISVNTATAHPHYDRKGAALNLGTAYTSYTIMSTPVPDKSSKNAFEKSKVLASIPFSKRYPSYYHSFGMSENYIIFPEMPLRLNLLKMLGATLLNFSFAETFEWTENDKTNFHLVDARTGENLKQKYTTDSFFTFHHANAYEQDGFLVVDCCGYKTGKIVMGLKLNDLREGKLPVEVPSGVGNLWRFVLPLKVPDGSVEGANLLENVPTEAKAVVQKDGSIHCTREIIGDKYFEFPRINYSKVNGRDYRYLYGSVFSQAGALFASTVCKIDVKSKESKEWDAGPKQIIGEPVFVERPGATDEDDGAILVPITNGTKGGKDGLAILDAKSFTLLAKATVEARIPVGFHAHYVPDTGECLNV